MSMVISPNAAPYLALITSEHNTKPNFMAAVGVVVGAAADAVAATQAIQPAFELESAVGQQLDILGRWIGQSRIIPNVLITGYFGFSELSTGFADGLQLQLGELSNPSLGGEFFNLTQGASGTNALNDAQYLTVLLARITRNQSNGTIFAIENALEFIFGAPCAVIDNGTLQLALLVPLPLTPTELALITTLDILPRPAGISITGITYVPPNFAPSLDSATDTVIVTTADGSEDDLFNWMHH